MGSPSSKADELSFEEKGSGTPVVLLHGFPLNRQVWAGQIAVLSKTCRVIAPDLQGFGESKSDRPFPLEQQADRVRELLTRLKALPCVLAGLSMGGYVALAFIKKYAADLRGLILVDTKAEGDTPAGKEGRNQMIALVQRSGSKAVADQMMPKMTAPGAGATDAGRRLRAIMESCPALTIEHALAAMRDRDDHLPNLGKIAVPTLVIVGEHDAITPPAVAQSVQRGIPGAKLTIIPAAGHMSPMEKPAAVSEAIARFVADLPETGRGTKIGA